MRFDKRDKAVKAPNALSSPLYKLTKAVVKAERSGIVWSARKKKSLQSASFMFERNASLLRAAILHSGL